VLTVVVLVLGGVVLGVADLPARSSAGTVPATRWLPPDGASLPGRTGGGDATATSALFAAPEATLSLPATAGATLIGALGSDLSVTVWRRTVASAAGDVHEVYTAGPDVRLLTRTAPRIVGYVGGILLLPHDVRPGSSWESSGSTVHPDGRPWRASFRAGPTDRPECLTTDGEVTVGGDGEGAGRYRVAQTWCRDRGLVRDSWTGPDGSVHTWTAAAQGTPITPDPTVVTADRTGTPASSGDPAGGAVTRLPAVAALPDGGTEPLTGSPAGPPLVTASGLVVVRSGADVVVLTPTGTDVLVVRHRLHPGGTVTAVGVFGDVVVSATTARELVGHHAGTGAVLWRSAIDDVADPVLMRLTDDAALVALASGQVLAVDLRTGTERWRATALVGQDFPASVAAVAGPQPGRVVLVAASTGSVELRDATTGRVRWTWRTDAVVEGVVLGADRAWVRTDRGLYGIDPATGRATVLRRAPATLPPLVLDGRLVLARPEGVRALDAAGQQVWRQPYGCLSTTVGPGGLLCWQGERVLLLDAGTGAVLAEHAVPEHGAGQLDAAVSGSEVWWRVTRVGPEGWVVFRWSR